MSQSYPNHVVVPQRSGQLLAIASAQVDCASPTEDFNRLRTEVEGFRNQDTRLDTRLVGLILRANCGRDNRGGSLGMCGLIVLVLQSGSASG
jgi:hypothetical protein